ncbi:M16 family metallopeptidase [Paludisphaera mucosa]|uniref:Pitrilysin family protein n=1 Tax=Paludisphaera mucosa TaxID=3030827 RepID=A0ABT6F6B0_9BACT|nr:pitrilysin family protein [Paludisphaera mucosa]MDG3003128.1 pitrilysin family protein [Paludisphaera mucosa]
MKRRFLCLIAAAGCLPAAAADDADRPPILPYPIRKSTLDNGLGIVTVPFDSPGIIAYYTVVRTGSRNEVEKGLSGFAHFFEHMMFRGTEKYSQEAYNDALKALGADSNAFTTDDWTCYHMTIPASALAKAVEIEADRFRNLKYDEPAFQKEARAVLGEYNKSASSPFLKLEEAIADTAFTTHTYKHTTIGFLADVKDMPNQYAYSKVFFDRWYRPENCTIVVAGQVDHDALLGLAKSHYGTWARGGKTVDIPKEPAQAEPRKAALTWPLPTLPTLALAYHAPAADPADPDVPALRALQEAVFGETSPLYRALVLDEQKAETLSAFADPHRDPHLFTVLARGRKVEFMPEIGERIRKALADAAVMPIAEDRLKSIQSHLRYAFAAELDSADAVARAVGESIAMTGRPEAVNELYAAYDRLTPADLQRVAARYFAATHETAVTLETKETK